MISGYFRTLTCFFHANTPGNFEDRILSSSVQKPWKFLDLRELQDFGLSNLEILGFDLPCRNLGGFSGF